MALILFIILFMILELFFGVFIVMSGVEMIKIKSLKKELQEYRKNKDGHDVIRDFLFGWRFSWGRKWGEWMIIVFGDRLLSRFYNAAGLFFLIASPLFFLAPLVQLPLILN